MSKLLLLIVISLCLISYRIIVISSKSKKEKFQTAIPTTTTLTPDPTLSYRAHEYAFKKYCESKGFVAKVISVFSDRKEKDAEGNTITVTDESQQYVCEVPNFEKCKELDDSARLSGNSNGYKWVNVQTRSINPELKGKQLSETLFKLKPLLDKYRNLPLVEVKAKQAVIATCFEKNKYWDPTLDNGAGNYIGDINVLTNKCNTEYQSELKAVEEKTKSDRKALNSELYNLIKQISSSAKISLNNGELSITDNSGTSKPIDVEPDTGVPIVSNIEGLTPLYIDTGYKEMCVQHPRFMETYCEEQQPCENTVDYATPEKLQNCTKADVFPFTLGNIICYPDQGYCDPVKVEDNSVANCVMRKSYCRDKMGIDYEEIETVTTVCDSNNKTDCRGVMPRGKCVLNKSQELIENLPPGSTLVRKYRAAGEKLVEQCKNNGPSSSECWNAITNLALITPFNLVKDTGAAYLAQTWPQFTQAWSDAFENPSIRNIDRMLDTVNLIPGVYVQGKMGEMLDGLMKQIPKFGEIWPDGYIKTIMQYFKLKGISPVGAQAMLFKFAMKELSFYALTYGPDYGQKGFEVLKSCVSDPMACLGKAFEYNPVNILLTKTDLGNYLSYLAYADPTYWGPKLGDILEEKLNPFNW
jgi:hypothetical protein